MNVLINQILLNLIILLLVAILIKLSKIAFDKYYYYRRGFKEGLSRGIHFAKMAHTEILTDSRFDSFNTKLYCDLNVHYGDDI